MDDNDLHESPGKTTSNTRPTKTEVASSIDTEILEEIGNLTNQDHCETVTVNSNKDHVAIDPLDESKPLLNKKFICSGSKTLLNHHASTAYHQSSELEGQAEDLVSVSNMSSHRAIGASDKYNQSESPTQNYPPKLNRKTSGSPFREDKPSVLADGATFLTMAAHALSRDEFSQCFEPKASTEIPETLFLQIIYFSGLAVRYLVLFPLRLSVLLSAMTLFIAFLPLATALLAFRRREGRVFVRFLFGTTCKVFLFAFFAIVHHHHVNSTEPDPYDPKAHVTSLEPNKGHDSKFETAINHHRNACKMSHSWKKSDKPAPEEPHLFVANHTSFIDWILLSAHGLPHATLAQIHGGLFGVLQRYVLSLNGSLFFNRNESKDRLAVLHKIQLHISKRPQIAPLLMFPEGTCVNNEYTVLFHKGAFELATAWVCPVAIKYNKRLSDPYWNTREQSFTQHLLYLMTRWILVADIWWLPPQKRWPDETGIQFANRVKALISRTAGLRDLSWDGYMKNYMRLQDRERMRRDTQTHYVDALRERGGIVLGLDTTLLQPHLPTWFGEGAIIDIKNKIIVDNVPSGTSGGCVTFKESAPNRITKLSPTNKSLGIANSRLLLEDVGSTFAVILNTWRSYANSILPPLITDVLSEVRIQPGDNFIRGNPSNNQTPGIDDDCIISPHSLMHLSDEDDDSVLFLT